MQCKVSFCVSSIHFFTSLGHHRFVWAPSFRVSSIIHAFVCWYDWKLWSYSLFESSEAIWSWMRGRFSWPCHWKLCRCTLPRRSGPSALPACFSSITHGYTMSSMVAVFSIKVFKYLSMHTWSPLKLYHKHVGKSRAQTFLQEQVWGIFLACSMRGLGAPPSASYS